MPAASIATSRPKAAGRRSRSRAPRSRRRGRRGRRGPARPRAGAVARRGRSRRASPRRRVRAACRMKRPIGPLPKTPTVMPGRTWARSTVCSATPSGSSIAPSAAVKPSGSGIRQWRGQAIHSRIEPSSLPWPEKRVSGQRFGWPSWHRAHCPHAIAGSIATSCPSSVRPAISWPGTSGRVDARAPDPALLEPVEVRPAQADRLDTHEGLAVAGAGPCLVVDPDVSHCREAARPSWLASASARSTRPCRACAGSACRRGSARAAVTPGARRAHQDLEPRHELEHARVLDGRQRRPRPR